MANDEIPIDEVQGYILQKVFEEFGINTGIFLDYKEIKEMQRNFRMSRIDMKRVPQLPTDIRFQAEVGGLHKDDVAIYLMFFTLKEAQLGVAWTFGIDNIGTHWFVRYDSTNPHVTAAQGLITQFHQFNYLATRLLLSIETPLRRSQVKSVSKRQLDEEIILAAKQFWIEHKKMQEDAQRDLEEAVERMLTNMSPGARERLRQSVTDEEGERRVRKFFDKVAKKKS
jgi:hypothetical protein